MPKLPDDLEDFVSKEVASLCDADPSVLAQYIVALIGPGDMNDDLRNSLNDKLNEFFDDQTLPFIDRLFTKIKGSTSESTTTASVTEATPSSSMHSVENENKERNRYDLSDDEDDDRNFKHRRQRAETASTTPPRDNRSSYKRRLDDDNRNAYSKYHRTDDRNDNQFHDNRYNRGGNRGMRGRGGMDRRGQNRPQCRDYNEKGFCMRGDMCPYDHGSDRIIVNDGTRGFSSPSGPTPAMGRPPQPPPFFGMPGLATDAYDPERSGILPPAANNIGGFIPPAGLIPTQEMFKNMMMMNNMRGGGAGGRGSGRGGGPNRGNRGGYSSRHHPYQHNASNSNNNTLTVEKIPVENCQISTVNDFFAKFGTITNISVQPNLQKATIQFSTHAEAQRAYSSPDPIFDNRFVKVYWAKEDPAAAPASPANATSAVQQQQSTITQSKAVNEPDPELVAARAAELAKAREEQQKSKQEHIKQILEVQKKREAQLQQQIDEQKKLLEKLSNNSSNMTQAEKADLLGQLKKIQGDIDLSRTAVAKGNTVQQNAVATDTTADVATEEGAAGKVLTEDLKKELARLEAEAAQLGIQTPGFRGGRGGYYGRGGRGGGWPRMRGGFTRMTLDNRPKKFVVKAIPAEATETDLRQHFEQFGNVTAFDKKDSELYVQYSQRFEAEKAMAMGQNFPKGALQFEWVTNEADPSTNHASVSIDSSPATSNSTTEPPSSK